VAVLDDSRAGRVRLRQLAGAIPICMAVAQRGCRAPTIPKTRHRLLDNQHAAPILWEDSRPGDDLYTACVLALNPTLER